MAYFFDQAEWERDDRTRKLVAERDRLKAMLERIATLGESDVWIPVRRASEMAHEALRRETVG